MGWQILAIGVFVPVLFINIKRCNMGWQRPALGFFISVLFINMMAQMRRLSRISEAPEMIAPEPQREGKTIRRWGCHRTETPFIFVHIGKAGGGNIRRKIAASAEEYGRGKQWRKVHLDEHHYPVEDEEEDSGVRHAKFCNSQNNKFQIPHDGNIVEKSFEGTRPCNATTPIGHAIGCPAVQKCLGCNDPYSSVCDTVYVGHNMLGNEMHWLPPKYLQKWWQDKWSTKSSAAFERINHGFQSIVPESLPQWCPTHHMSSPGEDMFSPKNVNNPKLMECSNLASHRADRDLRQYWGAMGNRNNYSPLYASLPLHRVVMLREPFSWIKSKFYWHKFFQSYACDDIQSASRKDSGWAYEVVKKYIMFLCGEDCLSRLDTNTMTFDDAIEQAESNLRNAFSVVGLLTETDSFYEMIDKRISYINMSLEMHPGLLDDGQHASGKGGNLTEYERCSMAYEDKSFQQRFKEQLPILASLEYLYKVGVEVNRFQKEELSWCH